MDGQLAYVDECVLVRHLRVQRKHLRHGALHEVYDRQGAGGSELGVADVGKVELLHKWRRERDRLIIKTKHFVGCPAERHECTCRFARNSSFCQTIANLSIVLLVEILYQAKFCLQISHPAILFSMQIEFLSRQNFIVHILLPGTCKAFTLSVFLPGARFHVVLPGIRFVTFQYNKSHKDVQCYEYYIMHVNTAHQISLPQNISNWSNCWKM